MATANKNGNQSKQPQQKGMRGLVIGMIIFVVAVGAAFAVISNQSIKSLKLPSSVSKADGYGITFNPTGSPKIDIWEDFQCPICDRFEGINGNYINQVVQAGHAKVVFHTMSFIGPESILAANAGACAANSGKFVQFHAALYNNQPTTENSGKITNPWLILIGAAAGISDSKFASCVNNGDYINWTKNIEADAAAKNVNATPTVFVNGKELDRNTQYMDPAAFKKALTDAGVK